MTDDQLLRRYVETRSDDAFAELARRHGDWVYSACLRRTGNRDDLAQDAAQAVFVTMARRAKDLVGRRSLAGWLFETAKYASLDVVKLERRRVRHEAEAGRMAARRRQVGESDVSWAEVAPRIEPALDRLPAKYREPILLRFYQGRSHAEIAQALDISESAAEKRVTRAVERLGRMLGARRHGAMTGPAVAGLLASHAVMPVPPAAATAIAGAAGSRAVPPRVELLTKGVLRMATVKRIKLAGTVVAVLAGSCAVGVVLRPYWGAPTWAQPAADASTGPVVAEVPGGLRIELVGVCDSAAAERPWWKPDGTPLAEAPYAGSAGISKVMMERMLKQAGEEGQVLREFAMRITQPAGPDAADVDCFVAPPANRPAGYPAGGGGGSGSQATKDVGPVRTTVARLGADPAGTTLRCRISSGAWTVRASAPAATGSPAGDGKSGGAKFSPAAEAHGMTRFTYSTSRPSGERWRLVAIDTDGNVRKAQVRGSRSFSGPDGSHQEMEAWVDLPVAKVKEFQFQTRAGSDQWVEFRNVCVDPAHPTHPQVGGGEKQVKP